MVKKPEPTTGEEKLEEILLHLRRMDARDRVRTWGGFFRGIITLIPTLVFLWGTWYFVQHGDELMSKVAKIAAEQAAAVTQMGTKNFMDQFKTSR